MVNNKINNNNGQNNNLTTNLTTLKGTIAKIFCSYPQFTSGKLTYSVLNEITQIEVEETISFSGKICLTEGQAIECQGKFINHPKYGEQFEIVSFVLDLQPSEKGLANYLANNPAFSGIGKVKANKIARLFWENFTEILENEPDKIKKAVKLSDEHIVTLQKVWKENQAINLASVELAGFELTHNQITKLLNKYGNSVITILKDNPYMLIKEIDGWGFRKVDVIAQKLGTPRNHLGRIEAGILYCLGEITNEGHTWIFRELLLDKANQLLTLDVMNSLEIIENQLNVLAEQTNDLIALTIDGEAVIGIKKLYDREQSILSTINKYANNPNSNFTGKPQAYSSLNEQQNTFITMAATNQISLLCGGAGTGKSFSLKTLGYLYKNNNKLVVFAAPTGKAARRITESTSFNASTIHSLLGYIGDGWAKNKKNPLKVDAVIIDEVSMCDVNLLWHLFDAIDFTRTALVMVGDFEQLPPVGPGNPLRDFLNSKILPTTILTECVRQAGLLKENSLKVLQGKMEKTPPFDPTKPGVLPWYLLERYDDQTKIKVLLAKLFSSQLADMGFHPNKDVQLLSPMKKGNIGTKALNVFLQQIIQRSLYGVEVAPFDLENEKKKPPFYLYDKVIQTKNIRELGVFNGMVGIITNLLPEEITVDFDGEAITFNRKENEDQYLELAYALTIHKVQGSEYPCVISIIHREHTRMHHQNLLYTAVTRARKTSIVIGDSYGIRNCVGTKQVDSRQTFLQYAGQPKRIQEFTGASQFINTTLPVLDNFDNPDDPDCYQGPF